MGIRRLNHAVLYVRDVDRSVGFYRDVLGFREVHRLPGAAFLRAAESDNDHDLGLFGIGDFLININRMADVPTSYANVRLRDMRPSRAELRQAFWPMVRGTLVGTVFGAMPAMMTHRKPTTDEATMARWGTPRLLTLSS